MFTDPELLNELPLASSTSPLFLLAAACEPACQAPALLSDMDPPLTPTPVETTTSPAFGPDPEIRIASPAVPSREVTEPEVISILPAVPVAVSPEAISTAPLESSDDDVVIITEPLP
jgi:hypothetical protein